MFDWIKNINKEHPEFWKNYLQRFGEQSARYVVISLECTGTNTEKDVILSIGAMAVVNDEILINDNFECVILQYIYMHDHGLSNAAIIESNLPKLSEQQAIEKFLEYIDNAILVGHRIQFEVDMINGVLEKMGGGRLKNQALDIEIMQQKLLETTDDHFTVEDISKAYKLPVDNFQNTIEKSYTIALLFLKLKTRLGFK